MSLKFALELQHKLLGTRPYLLVSNYLKEGGSFEALLVMSEEEWGARFETTPEALARNELFVGIERELELIEKHQIKMLTLCDPEYPESLRQVATAPIVLYYQGELSFDADMAIAMVGTRRPSLYGIESARRLARELAKFGIVIVSGLARGIDTCAHEGALDAKGKTIAVLGSGILNPYPKENKRLIEKILAGGGAIVSELPLTIEPLKHHFPMRNRIISGLSRGVCVVEAALRSGSLITAQLAVEEGREVYAVPGMMNALNSQGALKLIQEGAKLVRVSEDILIDFVPALLAASGEAVPKV